MASQRKRLSRKLAVAAVTAAFLLPLSAQAAPEPSLDEVQRKLDTLYVSAENSTEEFNGINEQLQAYQQQLKQVNERIAAKQSELTRMRSALGAIAAAQYRHGGMDPTMRLMLTKDPEKFLRQAANLDQLTQQQLTQVRSLRAAQQTLDGDKRLADRQISAIEKLRKELAARDATIRAKLNEAQKIRNGLSRKLRDKLDRGGDNADFDKILDGVDGDVSDAISFARNQIGKRYVRGATGPSAYDCSGLTMRSWQAGGVKLPRTAHSQYLSARRVPSSQAKPGDLVFFGYGGRMSHVGLYIGGNKMIHAPNPSKRVEVANIYRMRPPFKSFGRP